MYTREQNRKYVEERYRRKNNDPDQEQARLLHAVNECRKGNILPFAHLKSLSPEQRFSLEILPEEFNSWQEAYEKLNGLVQ